MLSTRFPSISLALRQVVFGFLLAAAAWGQQLGSLRGTVTDGSGAVVPGATVEIVEEQRVARHSQSDGLGNFTVPGLVAGEYSVRVTADGFEEFKSGLVKVPPGAAAEVAITLKVLSAMEQVTVTSERPGAVGVESADNANAVVLRGANLDALPDDSEELLADLQALAGPPLGSGGTQVYLDGFSSSRVPPKNAIREVHINQDPFSAQYDHVGFGRVEILTKPGAEQIHGAAQFKMSDAAVNSRNPYSSIKPPYQAKLFTADLGGPLNKRSSFFLNFEGRWAVNNEVVHATILDPFFNITALTQAVLMPDNEHSVGGRIDYRLNEKHSLTGRYEWQQSRQVNAGVGGFVLPSRAYTSTNEAHTFQLTENAILSSTALNQSRFQFVRSDLEQQAASFAPTIQVLDAFTSGGAQVGNSQHREDLLELQNYTTKTWGNHTLTFGGQFRRDAIYDRSPANFGGTFVFSGGLGPELDGSNQIVVDANGNPTMISLSSIQRYQRTASLLQAGFSPVKVVALGGGASQFSIAAGQPVSVLTQSDVGLFIQDSWHLTPNLSLNAGLRWEGQNDIHDWKDFAPRFGLAWKPGGSHGKAVIRVGAGIFYDRFPAAQVLQTLRFNGQTQPQYIVDSPAFYPQTPSIASLETLGLPLTVRTLARNLQSPFLVQASFGIEREMPLGILMSLDYIGAWGRHQLVSENLTAKTTANINYQYVSAGVLNQNQFLASVRRPFRGGIALFGRYEYNHALSNADGVNSFPAIQSSLKVDYGRAATDIRHTLVLGGSLAGPFGTTLNPFLVVRSGAPFNITTGHDNNGDTVFTDRPSFASDPNQPGVVVTPFGMFNPNPANGSAIIPHNYGHAPGFAMVNLRISRVFGFGPTQAGDATRGVVPVVPAVAGSRLFASPSSNHRYNVTVGIIVRNLLNSTNPGIPVGNLSSPYFGRSNWLASTAGPADIAFGNNRRIQFQLRFDF